MLLDDPGRVRSQITNVEGQIQRFDFDCNLVDLQAGLAMNRIFEVLG